ARVKRAPRYAAKVPVTDLSATTQDYLKVIWAVREWSSDEPVTISGLAQRAKVATSTISEAVKKLSDRGLLSHEKYGGIELTADGRHAAVGMVRRHRILETFLVEFLGYTWDE